jgi:Tol biopolymer transport system component
MKRFAVLLGVIAVTALSITALAQRAKEAETLFHRGVHFEEVRGELKEAIKIYEEIVAKYADDRPLAAKAYYHLGLCYEKMGRTQAADAFKMIVDKYPDQAETVLLAKEKLSLLARAETRGAKADEGLKISLVWQGSGMDSTGEISPDGKYLSCVDWTTSDLAVRDMATGIVRRLTSKEGSPPGSYEAPNDSIWSPDSRKIAYNWYGDNPTFCELRLIGLDDTKPRTLYKGDYFKDWVYPGDWSPDGRYILAGFYRGTDYTGPSRQLGLISVKDGSVHYLEAARGISLGLTKISPDGRHIVFDHPQKASPIKNDLSVIPIGGKAITAVVDHPADDRLLGWAPDGKSILFLSDRTGTWDAWMIPVVDGKAQGAPRLIRRELGMVKAMGLTRGGSLYYSTPGFEWDIFSASLDPDTGKILEPAKKLPLLHEGHNFSPKLSPDGKYLFYRSERGPERLGQQILCVFSFESGESREISPKASFRGFSIRDLTAEGHSILLHGNLMNKEKGFFKVDLESGDTTLLLREDDFEAKDEKGYPERGNAQLSHDGRSLIYSYQGPGKVFRVMSRRGDSNEETEICRLPSYDPSDNNALRLSPDGSRLAALVREEENVRAIKIFPAGGGQVREIHRFEQEGRWVIDMAWSPDGRYLYFSRQTDVKGAEKWQLWRVPSSGGEAQNLGLTANRFPFLRPHPDGKRVIFCSRSANEPGGAAIWVMENFLNRD